MSSAKVPLSASLPSFMTRTWSNRGRIARPVYHPDQGPGTKLLAKIVHDGSLGGPVEHGCRFREHHDGRVLEDGPGDGRLLSLCRCETGAADTDPGLQTELDHQRAKIKVANDVGHQGPHLRLGPGHAPGDLAEEDVVLE